MPYAIETMIGAVAESDKLNLLLCIVREITYTAVAANAAAVAACRSGLCGAMQ